MIGVASNTTSSFLAVIYGINILSANSLARDLILNDPNSLPARVLKGEPIPVELLYKERQPDLAEQFGVDKFYFRLFDGSLGCIYLGYGLFLFTVILVMVTQAPWPKKRTQPNEEREQEKVQPESNTVDLPMVSNY